MRVEALKNHPSRFVLVDEHTNEQVAIGKLVADPATIEAGTKINGLSFIVEEVVRPAPVVPGAVATDALGTPTVIAGSGVVE
jgi:hypothetical protein